MDEEAHGTAQFEDSDSTTTLVRLTISQIEQEVGVLPDSLSHDQMLEWLMLATVLVQRAREIKQHVEEVAIAWINSHGPLISGPITYTVGKQKQVKCTDLLRCMQLLLEACGGEVETFCTYLSVNAFKHGACHALLPQESWLTVFKEEWDQKIVLKSADARYLPRPKRGHVDDCPE